MLDIGVTKLAIIGGIALLVIGPEKLPGLAKTAGTLLGRARRYVADVKAEVSRSMEIDELKKMKATMETAVQDVQTSMHETSNEFEKTWADAAAANAESADAMRAFPDYKHPKKKWRLKQGATPRWYKVRTGMRTHALSGAARVARFRPPKSSR